MDYFILMRPTLFLPLWLFMLLGIYFAGGNLSLRTVAVFTLYTLLMGGTYIFNQIVDIESDKKNEKLFLLSDGIVPLRNAYYEMFILFAVSVIFSFFLGKFLFSFFLLSLFFGITYSLPPVEIKGKPFLDIIWNSFGYGVLAFSVGWLSVKGPDIEMWLHTVPYFFAVAAVFVNTTIPDIKGDREEGKITTGVFFGREKTLVFAVVFDIIAIISSIFLKDYICLSASALSLPIFLFAAIKKERKPILLSIRATAGIFFIAVLIVSPIIIPFFLAVVFLQKVYYRKKFNINYPSVFSGAEKEF